MTWLVDHWFHLLLISVYLAILVRHALVARSRVQSIADYLVAGRRLGGVVVALSFYATFMSTNTFIGAAGKSWKIGYTWCLGGLVLTAMSVLAWVVVAPRFVPLTRQYNSLTVADFLGTHYGSQTIRRVAAFIVAISSICYLVAIYRGASLALESFLGLPYTWAVLAVFLIVTAYTLLGGFESVVLTDALQGILMLIGAVALLIAMLVAGGGIAEMTKVLKTQDARLVSFTDRIGLAETLAYSLAVGVKYLVEPRQLSRFYGLRDAKALRVAAIVAPLAILVTYACLLPMGALARTIVPLDAVTQTDKVIPFLLGPANVLGTVTGTIFLLVLVSAAMSSIDSVLLVAASTIDRDLFSLTLAAEEDGTGVQSKQASKTQKQAIQRTRFWVGLVSLMAATTALTPFTKDIVEMTKFSGSLYGACFLPVLVLGLFFKNRSVTAALVTLALGLTTVIAAFCLRKSGLSTIQEVYPGIFLGIGTFVTLNMALKSKE